MITRHPILFSFIFVGFAFGALVFFIIMISLFSSDDRNSFIPFGDIVLLKIEGPIFDSTPVIRKFHRLSENKSIKAVVLRIDSPGGAVAPSQEIFEELKKLNKEKTVVVSMGTVAASGGYYIASAADKIFAQAGTVTGSIGVIMESFEMQGLIEWLRLKNRVLKSGKYKDAGSVFREMTDEEKEYLQSLLDEMYERFKKDVGEQRKISTEKMDEIAQGKVYTGEKALTLGLVDQLGTLYDAIDKAKELAGLPKDAKVIWPKEEGDALEYLLSSMVMSEEDQNLKKMIKHFWKFFNMPIGLYQMKEMSQVNAW